MNNFLCMDRLVSRDREFEADLESGGTTSEDERARDQIPGKGRMNGKLVSALSGVFGFPGSEMNEFSMNSCSSSSSFGAVEVENVLLLVEKNTEAEESYQCSDFGDRNSVEDERKKRNFRKPPKPPRPPKGPSLDAADQKLVREIAELAMRKRARMKRMRTLKKMKAAKESCSSSSLYAMIVTFLFCLVIIFQGICARNRGNNTLAGSPAPAAASSGHLISVQIYKNFTQD